jgi:hypothetical protein
MLAQSERLSGPPPLKLSVTKRRWDFEERRGISPRLSARLLDSPSISFPNRSLGTKIKVDFGRFCSTILRAIMQSGSPGDENMNRLQRVMAFRGYLALFLILVAALFLLRFGSGINTNHTADHAVEPVEASSDVGIDSNDINQVFCSKIKKGMSTKEVRELLRDRYYLSVSLGASGTTNHLWDALDGSCINVAYRFDGTEFKVMECSVLSATRSKP